MEEIQTVRSQAVVFAKHWTVETLQILLVAVRQAQGAAESIIEGNKLGTVAEAYERELNRRSAASSKG